MDTMADRNLGLLSGGLSISKSHVTDQYISYRSQRMVPCQSVPISLSCVPRENDAAETAPVEWCISDGAGAQADEQEQASAHTSVVRCQGPLG